MVETYKPKNKRQKIEHVHPTAPLKGKKGKKAAQASELVNVNVEEYKDNPEAFEEEKKESSGT